MGHAELMAQPVTGPQVLAVVERARKKYPRPVIVVKGEPTTELTTLRLAPEGAETIAVHATRSPLELRRIELASRDGEGTVVVITDLDENEIGTDLKAKIAGTRIWTPDRWEAVKAIFGVRSISRDLTGKKHLADALIESRPVGGYRAVRSGTLDLQTAVDALLRSQLGINGAGSTLERFITWIVDDDSAVGRLLAASDALNTDATLELDDQLADRLGEGVRPVLAIVRAKPVTELLPLLFVGGAVHAEGEPHPQGGYALQLDLGLGRTELASEAWEHAARAALDAAWSAAFTDAERRAWSSAAEARLEQYLVPELAERSAAIASGFDRLLAQLGRELANAQVHAASSPGTGSGSGSAGSAGHAIDHAIDRCITEAKAHKFGDDVRVGRAVMAARLIRRGAGPIEWGTTLASAGAAYRNDGAWVDRARNAIARDDTVPELTAVYRSLGEQFNEARAVGNAAFARIAAAAAQPLPDDVTGIEDVLRAVVAPAAAKQPVLLLVFDGMGYESFTEVSPLFEQVGLVQVLDPAATAAKPCYAVLPTVTKYSRTSLFAGTVRDGDQASEKRAFEAVRDLLDVSTAADPPVIYHKADLRGGGIDSIPPEALNDIANDHQRVVAVVLNNIDERLKDVSGPVAAWGFDELHPLKWLLEAARDAGRIVIATSDHGHVLDRDAEQRQVPGARERWRSADGEPAADEILVEGPRVAAEGQRAFLPFAEQLHYDARRNGYHGGLCPQEVLVPIGVYATPDAAPETWSTTALPEPDWWIGLASGASADPVDSVEPPKKRGKKPKAPSKSTPTLFDVAEPAAADQAPALAGEGAAVWVESVIVALAEFRRPQTRLTDDEARRLLTALERAGSQPLPLDRLAAVTQFPRIRITRYISQLQRLVNIDGYGILTVVGDDVHFQRDLLETQLGL